MPARRASLSVITPREVEMNMRLFDSKVPDALWADLKSEGLLRQDAPVG